MAKAVKAVFKEREFGKAQFQQNAKRKAVSKSDPITLGGGVRFSKHFEQPNLSIVPFRLMTALRWSLFKPGAVILHGHDN